MRRLASFALVFSFAATQHALAAPDGGTDARAAFDAATERAQADPAGAEGAFTALVDAHPDDALAPDALAEAAELDEERLGHPDRAQALYRRLVDRYPRSRLALRARARLEFLDANLRGGVEPLAEFEDILNHYGSRPPSESRARMERLVAAHPDFPLASRALLWLAADDLRAGRTDAALAGYRDVERRFPSGEIHLEAVKGEGDALLAGGHYVAARRVYRQLVDLGDARLADAGMRGAAIALRRLVWFALYLVAAAYALGFLVVAGARAGRSLAAIPVELKFYLPLAALFVVGTARQGGAMLAAVAGLAVAGALVTWVAGAWARARRVTALFVVATVAAVLALVVVTLHATGTLDLVVQTARTGPER